MSENLTYDVVLVGGGPSTRILNKYLHKLDPNILTLVIRDEERIINHCGTPYIVEGVVPWEKGLISEKLVTQFGTEILLDPAVGGDPDAHYVETASGRKVEYRKLVIATGSEQVVPAVPGVHLDGVLKVRRTEDVKRTIEKLSGVEKLIVVGAGYIGLEFAAALKHMGKKVTIIELCPHVMGDRIDETMAGWFERHLRGLGIELELNSNLIEIEGREGRVTGVRLEDGRVIQADAVLSAVGVKPIVDFALRLGVETTALGIRVDEYFRTNIADVYAIGDCIATRCAVTGREVPGKLGSNAGQMARYLGLNLTGTPRAFPGVINAAVTVIDGLAYGCAGLSEKDAVEAGVEVLVSRNTSSYPYDNMPDSKPVEVKTIYRADDSVLIGAEIMGQLNPAGFVETAALLIQTRAKLDDVITMPYSSHPELTPKTSKPYWVWGSEPLFFRMKRKQAETAKGNGAS